jgi:hypothetical protein
VVKILLLLLIELAKVAKPVFSFVCVACHRRIGFVFSTLTVQACSSDEGECNGQGEFLIIA